MATGQEEGWKYSGWLRGAGIPAPTGRHRVGCVDLMHQLAEDERGGLLMRLFYPTEASPAAGYSYSSWYPDRAYIKGYLTKENPGSSLGGILSVVINTITSPKIPALDEAPLLSTSTSEGDNTTVARFPVVVFSHGLSAMRLVSSGIACDLASHGYVVACVEHRDSSASASLQRVPKPGGREGELQDQWIPYIFRDVTKVPDDPVTNAKEEFPFRNKQVKQRADEVGKVLDILTLLDEGAEIKNMMAGNYDFKQFKGRLDISTAVVMGHSFGGATTVQTLATDTRFRCGIALDCWMIPIDPEIYSNSTSISQPLYFINSYTFQWRENMRRMLSLVRPQDDNGVTSCRILTIKGTNHINQTDAPFIANATMGRWFGLESSELPGEVAHQVNMDICHAFLRRHLLKDPNYQEVVPDLDGTEGHSEHILFGTNVRMACKTPVDDPAKGEKRAEPDTVKEEEKEGAATQDDTDGI